MEANCVLDGAGDMAESTQTARGSPGGDRKLMNIKCVSLLVLGLSVSGYGAEEKLDLKNPKQRVSYSIGANIASSLKRQELELDEQALTAGLTDGLKGKTTLTESEIQETLTNFQKEMSGKMELKQKELGEKNLKDGDAFLVANGKKDGVKTVASGLQYKVLQEGKGKSPKSTDTVKVHYHGTLLDGTVFDSSVERKEPVTFALNEVIPGWTEALQLMKVGDKWRLFIPSKLAYGPRAAGEKIGPNCTLIFDVELLSIEAAN
jgi:FKBP-type peptidyl-prolyl cis-trans isomerase FklB